MLIYGVALLRWLQEVRGNILRKLMIFGPLANGFEVLAFVPGVEVHIRLRPFLVPPYLSENTGVDCAHELLPNDVQTVG